MWFPVYALYHDLKYFPESEKFQPERFSDENKNKSRVLSFTLLKECDVQQCYMYIDFSILQAKYLRRYLLFVHDDEIKFKVVNFHSNAPLHLSHEI